jgi:hypothetical protein
MESAAIRAPEVQHSVEHSFHEGIMALVECWKTSTQKVM